MAKEIFLHNEESNNIKTDTPETAEEYYIDETIVVVFTYQVPTLIALSL